MKKYVFRLETVRRVRKVQEEIAKSQLMAANNEVTAAIKAVEQRSDKLNAAERTAFGAANTETFMNHRYFSGLAGQAVVAAQASRRAAELEAVAKRDLYAEAAKRVRALDRLDDHRRDDHTIEMRREEERLIDDVVNSRHMRRAR
jgi:flagellar export protein FliJ